MNKEFRDWLESEIQSLKDIKYASLVEFGIQKKLELVIKKYDELSKSVVIPKYVAEYLDWFKYDFGHNIEDDVDLIVSLVQVSHAFLGRKEVKGWLKISGNAHKLIDACRWGYDVEEVPLYHALVKGHELLGREYAFKYWSYDTFDDDVFTCELPFPKGRYITEMSKEGWSNLGINESNADFVRVGELFNSTNDRTSELTGGE